MAARERGLVVPDDFSVVGFDDIDLAEAVSPKLTTLHVPHRKMGRALAGLVAELLTGAEHVPDVELETHIVERDSLTQRP